MAMSAASTAPDSLEFKGSIKGHKDVVTSITFPSRSDRRIMLSSSRDKTALIWRLEDSPSYGEQLGVGESVCVAYPHKRLRGHSQAVQDIVLSSDGNFAISGAWDKTLRLWDLTKSTTVRTFKGHTSDVFSVAFSSDNRQIVSCGRDKTIRLWNTLAECKFNLDNKEEQHKDWISSIQFSPLTKQSAVVTCSWDGAVKVWDLEGCKLRKNMTGHGSALYAVTISPDGSLCASGGKDGVAMLWDVNEGNNLYSLQASSPINALCFSPCNYWLCAATDASVVIWDLENKNVLAEILAPAAVAKKKGTSWYKCLTWSHDGRTLYVGCNDGSIQVYDVSGKYT